MAMPHQEIVWDRHLCMLERSGVCILETVEYHRAIVMDYSEPVQYTLVRVLGEIEIETDSGEIIQSVIAEKRFRDNVWMRVNPLSEEAMRIRQEI